MKKKETACPVKVSKIGGQAVLEGVMMRGLTSMATSVRAPSGDITTETERVKPKEARPLFFRLPFVRGVYSMLNSLYSGTKTLMRTAEVYAEIVEPPADAKEGKDGKGKSKINPQNIMLWASVLLGIALAVGLFIVLPSVVVTLLYSIPVLENTPQVVVSLTQGAVKLILFLSYLSLISLMKDIKRLFRYHGAEHKVINCYERGLEMNVENARGMTTINPRCGTTFLFIVMTVSIFTLSLVSWLIYDVAGFSAGGQLEKVVNALVRIGVSLALLPIVAGISFELLMLFAKSDNILFRALRAPGMLLQKLTTKEPDDQMLEVALTAFNTVLEMDADASVPCVKFDIKVNIEYTREKLAAALGEGFEQADADWLLCEVTGVSRDALPLLKVVDADAYNRLIKLAAERALGKPLQYILGYSEFYGIKLSVNDAVLIPRPETELLAERAVQIINSRGDGARLLDICTGSGAIAIAAAKNTSAEVVASDISEVALAVARANALSVGARVKFIKADLFGGIEGGFDVITANPPYIPSADIEGLDKNVKDFEPRIALDGGADGLDFVRRIAATAGALLNSDGTLLVEVGVRQAAAAAETLLANGFSTETVKDYSGIERFLVAKKTV
ncbi:MAG: peptide chain release factor N(5)-glutamine methyltransferase [Clostridiaceae bacterium]|jgi:release factor-specific protein-(glutamine-N5) methyltransferase|nr:peptide chain release factor N(5)-glutamine methyltransferase [Clostridiaceae bacterium]